MAGFLYFRAGDTRSVDHRSAAELGLDYALSDAQLTSREAIAGPAGLRGVVFADERQQAEAPGYYADRQVWRELPRHEGRPRLFVGYYRDAKPTPAELLRERSLPGLIVTMADGLPWQVPEVISRESGESECRLPCQLDYDLDGRIVPGEPIEAYRVLWELITPIAAALFDGEPLDDGQVQRGVVALLQANYRVALPELVQLGVLANDASLATAVMASCQYDELLRWADDLQKKSGASDPVTSPTGDGRPA